MLAKSVNSIDHNNAVFTVAGYDVSKYNALKHGVLSKYTVMQWENREDYETLISSLINEYIPSGVTEEHLVEELAGIIWRKMRLRYAEMTSIQTSLINHIERDSSFGGNYSAKDALLATSYEVKDFDIRQVVTCTDIETHEALNQTKEKFGSCVAAEQILEETDSYEDGLCALHEEDRSEWQNEWLGAGENREEDCSNDDEVTNEYYTASVEDLAHYINERKKYYEKRIYELESRSKVKQQILGKSFLSDKELDKYVRYESHLDRKFEKTLAMLIKLQELKETIKPKNTIF